MIQKNKELVAKIIGMGMTKAVILASPLITLVIVVWVYTQRYAGVSYNMDLAIVGVNTASFSLAIYLGYFIILRVAGGVAQELNNEGLLTIGAQWVEPEEDTLNKVTGGVLNGVSSVTSFKWLRKPVKRQLLAIEAPKTVVADIPQPVSAESVVSS